MLGGPLGQSVIPEPLVIERLVTDFQRCEQTYNRLRIDAKKLLGYRTLESTEQKAIFGYVDRRDVEFTRQHALGLVYTKEGNNRGACWRYSAALTGISTRTQLCHLPANHSRFVFATTVKLWFVDLITASKMPAAAQALRVA